MTIDTLQNIILIFMMIILTYLFWLHMRKSSLEAKISQKILQAISEATQEAKNAITGDFESFRAHFAIDYEVLLNKIKEQQKQIDTLTEYLNKQTEAMKQYATQNEEIERLRKELHKTQNMLSRCKKKLQRTKDAHEAS